MKIFIKGNKTEITQLINNISNNAKDLKDLSREILIIDELEYTINSISVDARLHEEEVCVELETVK